MLDFQAFTARGSKDLSKSIGVDIRGTVTHSDEIELTYSLTTDSLRDFTHQDQARCGDVAGVQADATVNISRASLKRIDPDLRAKPDAKQNNEEDDP